MRTKQALILFTRDPLRESIQKRILNNPKSNIALYQNLISHTLQIVGEARLQESFDIFITSKSPISSVDTSCITGFIAQQGNSFARRLQYTIEQVFSRGYQQVVIIGNDCPDLSANQVITAFTSLQNHDVVLGPATDGGVYLIGVNRSQPYYFSDINWFSASVYADLLRNIQAVHETVHTLDILSDIDTVRALARWSRKNFNHLTKAILQLLNQPAETHFICDLNPFNHKRHRSRRSWQKAPPLTF